MASQWDISIPGSCSTVSWNYVLFYLWACCHHLNSPSVSIHLGIHGTLLQVNGGFGGTHYIDVCMDNCSRRETNYCFVPVLSKYVFIYHLPSFPFDQVPAVFLGN